jgi:hypothetical protein
MTKEKVGDFDVEIVGTSITAVHRTHGHYYTTHWHVDLPYLTNQGRRPNGRADRDVEGFEIAAWDAMCRKLERDELI